MCNNIHELPKWVEKRLKYLSENKLMTTEDFLKKIDSWEKEISWRFDFSDSWELLRYLKVDNMIFKNCEFSDWDFLNSDFKKCTFENVLFFNTQMPCISFYDCIIYNCIFQNVNSLPSFENCNIAKTNMTAYKHF